MKLCKIVPLLVLALVITSGCSKTDTTEETQEKPISVSVSEIQKTRIESTRTIVGKVKPAQEISVYSKIPGKVEKVFVDIGQEVKKGQTLLTIDDTDVRLQVNQAETALNAARANMDRTSGGAVELQLAQLETNLISAEMNMNDAKTSFDSIKMLYEQGATSKQNYDAAELRYKNALEQYNLVKKSLDLTKAQINPENTKAVEAQVKQALAAYEQAKTQLDNVVINSPIDGIISARSFDEGELISSAAPAFTIVDISSVVVEINLLEDMAGKIAVGDTCEILVKSTGDNTYRGEVISISPNADPRTQTYLVKLRADNQDGKLKGGMLAEVKLITESKDNVMVVPLDAVVNEGGKNAVYVIEGDEAVKKEVSVGLENDKFIEVSGDLKEADKVIIKGQNLLKDRSKITVVN